MKKKLHYIHPVLRTAKVDKFYAIYLALTKEIVHDIYGRSY